MAHGREYPQGLVSSAEGVDPRVSCCETSFSRWDLIRLSHLRGFWYENEKFTEMTLDLL